MIRRVIASIFVLMVGVFFNAAWSPQSMLLTGNAAGQQFEASGKKIN